MLRADRRLRQPGDVGWHRRPPMSDAGMADEEHRRPGAPVHPPSPHGFQPEEHLGGKGAPWIRPALHGNSSHLHAGECDLPHDAPPSSSAASACSGGTSAACCVGSRATRIPNSDGSSAATNGAACSWESDGPRSFLITVKHRFGVLPPHRGPFINQARRVCQGRPSRTPIRPTHPLSDHDTRRLLQN